MENGDRVSGGVRRAPRGIRRARPASFSGALLRRPLQRAYPVSV
ncbi:conserved hypothetical protein [Burkholderia pseudomallei Pakistan 9]|nr:conserved hypothetical protein [Burkholderia pseudomallei Pakistan 9]